MGFDPFVLFGDIGPFWELLFDHRSNRRIPPNASGFIDFHTFRKLFDPGDTAVDNQWNTWLINSFFHYF
jgi:hypothetical protein